MQKIILLILFILASTGLKAQTNLDSLYAIWEDETQADSTSQATFELLQDDSDFNFKNRGKIEVKGKGELEMYFVEKS